MGRSGGSSSGGGGSSHSSHSSSGSHHSSHSSSRNSSFSSHNGSSFRSDSGWSRNTYSRNYTHIGPTYVGGSSYRSPSYNGYHEGRIINVVIAIFIIMLVIMVIGNLVNNATHDIPNSTVERTRLSAGSFTSDCVEDHLGWIQEDGSSPERLGRELRDFWEKTGIQPYVVLLPYSTSYDTADEQFDWTENYFSQLDRDDAILLTYFDDEPDGQWELTSGTLTLEVMDPEAEEIFWNTLDRYWNDVDNYNVPEAISTAFTKSAERIMTKTTTGMDVLKIIVIIALVLIVGIVILTIMKTKRRHDAEKAAETERILNTPINDIDTSEDTLVNKYTDNDSK